MIDLIKIPTNCPKCDSILEMVGENLMCLNSISCPAQVLGRVLNWVSGLNLLEWGDVLIQKLVDSGLVNDPADLYTLTMEQLLSLDRMGEKSSEKCLNILHSNKNLSLDVFIGSLSIHLSSQSTIKLLMSNGFNDLNALKNATLKELSNINGMGDIKSQYLFDGLKTSSNLIDKLLNNGITIKDKVMGNLSGKSFCFSGKFSVKRDELEKMVVDAGGDVKGSVGKTLSYLVLEDANSTSSKAVAARKNNTLVIDEIAFYNLLKV